MQCCFYSCFGIAILISVLFLSGGSCTECWKCENATNVNECADFGVLMKCGDSEVCSTEVRKNYGEVKIWKGCKQREACEHQRLQNWNTDPHTCNNDQDHSHCWCCCDNDSCNKNETCEVVSTNCPMPSLQVDHGNVTCSNSNHLGSLCSYQCTEKDYRGLPRNKQNRLCLGNGKWSEKKPCCVKKCPPYLPIDSVAVAHFKDKESFRERHKGIGTLIASLVTSKEYHQQYIVYFNEKVYNVISPEDPVRMGQYDESVNNTANTGAALRYVRDNILTQFHRRDQHNDVVFVGVEKPSDDDVTEAAADLKKDGALMYYIFYESVEHKLNMEEAMKVASSKDHILVVGGKKNADFENLFKDLLTLACNYACPNAEDE